MHGLNQCRLSEFIYLFILETDRILQIHTHTYIEENILLSTCFCRSMDLGCHQRFPPPPTNTQTQTLNFTGSHVTIDMDVQSVGVQVKIILYIEWQLLTAKELKNTQMYRIYTQKSFHHIP